MVNKNIAVAGRPELTSSGEVGGQTTAVEKPFPLEHHRDVLVSNKTIKTISENHSTNIIPGLKQKHPKAIKLYFRQATMHVAVLGILSLMCTCCKECRKRLQQDSSLCSRRYSEVNSQRLD